MEQWIVIKFYVKIDKSATETLSLLTLVHDEYAMQKLSVLNVIGISCYYTY
jgi:hypothetical protein